MYIDMYRYMFISIFERIYMNIYMFIYACVHILNIQINICTCNTIETVTDVLVTTDDRGNWKVGAADRGAKVAVSTLL
jgi:hypothetical protein